MHFLYVLLQLLWERLLPTWRDGLTMAARSDGRVEQVPTDLWSRWQRWWQQPGTGTAPWRSKTHSAGDAARGPRSRSTPHPRVTKRSG